MNRIRQLAIAAALIGTFTLGVVTVSAVGRPSEAWTVAGLEACLVMDKALELRIPADRLPETAARCDVTKRLLPVIRGR